ncbi:MAG: copper amine oxidase N-terminal domain-containing protein [Oscillospiraceae bacterium]|nr:copper amine oxidase N-terminal domain-containing protein [Oscillospiraceae bacterium]
MRSTQVWNYATVTIALDGETLTLQIGRLDEGMLVAPIIKDDRTFVPLRYVSETLGCNVVWTEATQEIDIYR